MRIVVPNLRFAAKRILDDNMIIEDFWVLYGEQDYPKNFHSVGFTPKSIKALFESLDIFEDIQVKEGDVNGPPNPHSWNLQVKATKVRHPMVENIAPADAEAPDNSGGAWWPVRLYDTHNVRTIEGDKESDAKLAAPAIAKEKKERLLKKVKEGKDGLESDL
jgi:hypothetical protein